MQLVENQRPTPTGIRINGPVIGLGYGMSAGHGKSYGCLLVTARGVSAEQGGLNGCSSPPSFFDAVILPPKISRLYSLWSLMQQAHSQRSI